MPAPTPLRVRYSKIAHLVENLLIDSGVSGPSVPVEQIARARGLTIKLGPLGDVSGMLVRSQEEPVIGVNSQHSRQRRRFTIAHELGHYLLHEGLLSHVDHDFRVNYRNQESSLATNTEEIEANFFAASLLMPESFLDKLNAASAVADDDQVGELAKQFDVSRHAMSLRLVNLYGRYKPY